MKVVVNLSIRCDVMLHFELSMMVHLVDTSQAFFAARNDSRIERSLLYLHAMLASPLVAYNPSQLLLEFPMVMRYLLTMTNPGYCNAYCPFLRPPWRSPAFPFAGRAASGRLYLAGRRALGHAENAPLPDRQGVLYKASAPCKRR